MTGLRDKYDIDITYPPGTSMEVHYIAGWPEVKFDPPIRLPLNETNYDARYTYRIEAGMFSKEVLKITLLSVRASQILNVVVNEKGEKNEESSS